MGLELADAGGALDRGAIHDDRQPPGSTPMLGALFDPQAPLFVQERLRPHWSQAGAIVFITFRTKDSIPASVIARWDREQQAWVERVLAESRGPLCGPTPPFSPLDRGAIHDDRHWSRLLPLLTERQRREFRTHFNRCRETTLDECLGACVLKRPELARVVADALLHFDGDRYRLGDFVVMPNHVHLLAAFSDSAWMRRQVASWLHYTAAQIHRRLGLSGHFGQQEPFDHLVRSPEQYDYLRNYIAANPARARLQPGEFLYRRYDR